MSGNGSRPALGEILVREMGLAREDLQKALVRQAELAAGGRYYLLGRVLLGLGYVSLHQLEAALELQREEPEPGEEKGVGERDG